ncbi:hypothetical protein Verru16b_02813 [Lacunisphaera limnophila]|uniref:Glycosyltransferase RgtA/B/C/D-like domain-containing protein n=1 Tax=Lacunisphaera limnophila TaxID=1838286 RepID=A0A1D8AXV9_9BACT|nr:hypothetical protein [Lacunisphaera limnophila]AOS45726.1 hypothetical protein Verru16b_02813 [Lacunisphaera limnophila]
MAIAIVASVLLAFAVFSVRGFAAVEAAGIPPGVAFTSGWEEESHYALWRVLHDQPLYADTARPPFASAYFNWLFYSGYAWLLRPAVALWGDACIPFTGRLITATFTLAGAGAFFLVVGRALTPQGRLPALGLATLVFLGPLSGWWAHTVRPDMGALMLETMGLAIVLLGARSRPWAAVLLGGLCFYGAWACKQTYVFGAGTAVLYLFSRRLPRHALVLSGGCGLLGHLTLALLGPTYQAAFRETTVANAYSLSLGLTNTSDMLLKTAPLWLLGWVGFLATIDADRPLAKDLRHCGLIGLGLTLPLLFIANCKLGASSYYYLPVLPMLGLVATGGLVHPRRPMLCLAGFALAGTLSLLLLSGRVGRLTLDEQADELAAIWQVWQNEAEPRFSHRTNLNLPWLNASSPPFVLAYNYQADRQAGRRFADDGIGGLISRGYFRSLLLPRDTGEVYDGGRLDRYRGGETMGNMRIFRLVEPTPGAPGSGPSP